MGTHLVDGKFFQSDKYPTTPLGKVPLSVKDVTAQDLLWEYAQRRRSVDAEFSEDLQTALLVAGFKSKIAETNLKEGTKALLDNDDAVQAWGLSKIADGLELSEGYPTGSLMRKQIIEIMRRCADALVERSKTHMLIAKRKDTCGDVIPEETVGRVGKAPWTVRERLLWAATMLHIHGFMGDIAVQTLRRRIERSKSQLDSETRPLGE